jgi:glutamine amidotransferase
MIAIVDYGMGNIHSVRKALAYVGAKTIVTSKPGDLQDARKLVLPGVGAFDDAMEQLNSQGLSSAIHDAIRKKKPFMGICLGLQLLFETSQEATVSQGLGIVKGQVRRFTASGTLKVPHMGWNQLKARAGNCPLLRGVDEGAYVYFCHSYYPHPDETATTAASCDYGVEFSCMIWQDNVYGVQFHPEKSQTVGLQILKNFVSLQ